MKKTVLNVNIAEFLAEFFMNRIGEKVQFSYGLFWDAFHEDYGTPESINGLDEDSNLYYEYGLLKAEEEMKADHDITERWLDNCSMWSYEFKYYNADGVRLTRRTITAMKICRENTVRMLPRFTRIGCGYKFRCSNEYEAYMLMVGDVEGNNVCNAIDAAWTWFHTGFVNNFISKDPETNLLHLNW